MPPPVIPELGSVAEISAETGQARTTVSMWDTRRESSGMPEPLARLACGPIFDMNAVRTWYAGKRKRKAPTA